VSIPATLLFVHGTGVRGVSYAATLRQIVLGVQRQGLDVDVRGCYWGGSQGARLRLGGGSVPGYASAGGHDPTEVDEMMALWSVLYTDPWYELRLLRNFPSSGPFPFGQEPPSEQLRRSIAGFVPSEELKGQLVAASLDHFLEEALVAIQAAPEFDQAVATAPAAPLVHRQAIARAIVAFALVAREEVGQPPPDGATRDEIVERITSELHGFGMGVSDFLVRPLKGLALRLVTRKLTGDRGSITDAAAPTAGDVLRFLARGDHARAFIKQSISDCGGGPLVIVAHSLGGIMCTDLLIREAIPQVSALVTVGSQAPFFYEIGALPSLEPPQPLPVHFPRWLNIYDRRDLLSYVGAEVFENRVTDRRVDNGQPFPQSHSAYWANADVWKAVAGFLP
jgi:hypothetical protein